MHDLIRAQAGHRGLEIVQVLVDLRLRQAGRRPGADMTQRHPWRQPDQVRLRRVTTAGDDLDLVPQRGQGIGRMPLHDIHPTGVAGPGRLVRGGVHRHHGDP
jgi:hypothetical protein